MSAQEVSAIAAVAAVAISLVNVGLSSLLVHRQESRKWKREQLPDRVTELASAAFRWEVKIFESDWTLIPKSDRLMFGMDEAKVAMELVARLEVFAAPKTISTAQEMLNAIDQIRMYHLRYKPTEPDAVPPTPWDLYGDWAEAHHAFLVASRREMGLKPPPIPSGLRHHRDGTAPHHESPTQEDRNQG